MESDNGLRSQENNSITQKGSSRSTDKSVNALRWQVSTT